jgi:hypothetical protein
VEWCASSASTSLDGIARRGLGDGRVLMDSCRAEALSSVMVVSMVGTTKIMPIFI